MTAPTLPVKVDRGNGPALVLLHGLGNNHESWTYVLREIDESRNRIIAPDLLGFGDAPKPQVDYTPGQHADAVIATLDELGVSTAVVAGHSMGCIVAAEVARKRPDLVSRLVLLGAPTFRRIRRTRRRFRSRVAEDRYSAIFNAIADSPDLTITAAKGLDVFAPLVKGMEITEETWPAFRSSLQHTIMQTRTYRDLMGLPVPTLLVYGRLDVFVIKRNLKAIARRNRRHVRYETLLGPHEITPVQGRAVAEMLQSDPS
ncbi:alpha/beta fold hydrolase [Occultella gossypii]|uniref:Alpha/beta fold hydrolase n=1 Tax=Occultella gossypii TaxID=2800820 RepID=A0ABS7SF56_9MICO|nr:alpha/beta hydrolase [Occultella gossypii]MBZ2198384.1 alpha/beta fold hydrolase [Occultella gossypii]